MNDIERSTLKSFESIPNVGKVIAHDLRSIGLLSPKDLCGQDPWELYERVNKARGAQQDPCLLDVLMSAVDYMGGGKKQPWWAFTGKRKKIYQHKLRKGM